VIDRRTLLQLGALAIARRALAKDDKPRMLTRAIPKTGEQLPVIGLGTWQTFDVATAEARQPLEDVLRAYFAAGGRVIDSSPMYGAAEATTGDVVDAIGATGTPFLATKVWISGRAKGIAQIAESMRRMKTKKLDLMQVHNLLDVDVHLPVLRDMKAAGTIRYLGVTHYQRSELPRIEQLMKTGALDFVQVPYSIADRTVEARTLPVAVDTKTAVLVMQPFESGALFTKVAGKTVPEWMTKELDCESWAQVFLKFLVGHPAVTAPIPATSKLAHLRDNVKAGFGRIPDDAQRKRMIKELGF